MPLTIVTLDTAYLQAAHIAYSHVLLWLGPGPHLCLRQEAHDALLDLLPLVSRVRLQQAVDVEPLHLLVRVHHLCAHMHAPHEAQDHVYRQGFGRQQDH